MVENQETKIKSNVSSNFPICYRCRTLFCYGTIFPFFQNSLKTAILVVILYLLLERRATALPPKHNTDKYKWTSRLCDLHTTSHHLTSSCKHSILYFGFYSLQKQTQEAQRMARQAENKEKTLKEVTLQGTPKLLIVYNIPCTKASGF